MPTNFEKFIAAYQIADPRIKQIIDSEEIGLFVSNLTGIGEYKSSLIILISNVVLGTVPKTELTQFLSLVGISDAEKQAEILSFVNKLTEPTQFSPRLYSETPNVPSASETATTPIPQLRTMAGDGKQIGYQSLAETTYTSTQDSLMDKTE
jgi:hypothetical protein